MTAGAPQSRCVEVDVKLVLGELTSIARPRHACDQFRSFPLRKRHVVGDGTVGMVTANPPGVQAMLVGEFVDQRWQVPAVVFVGTENLRQQNPAVAQRGDDLHLEPLDQHRRALAAMPHVWVGYADDAIAGLPLDNPRDLAVAIKLDVLIDDVSEHSGGFSQIVAADTGRRLVAAIRLIQRLFFSASSATAVDAASLVESVTSTWSAPSLSGAGSGSVRPGREV